MQTDQRRVEVIVHLAAEATAPDSHGRHALQACAARIGVSLEPLHPATFDPELARYFVAHVEPAALSGIVEQLRNCEGVDGAYAKPRGETP